MKWFQVDFITIAIRAVPFHLTFSAISCLRKLTDRTYPENCVIMLDRFDNSKRKAG